MTTTPSSEYKNSTFQNTLETITSIMCSLSFAAGIASFQNPYIFRVLFGIWLLLCIANMIVIKINADNGRVYFDRSVKGVI